MKEHYVLAIDVAKSKSMVSLISYYGEVIISPYEINHNLNDFKNLDNLDDKSLKEISLWVEYILYALILNESVNLLYQAKNEYTKLVKIIYKK